MMKWQVIILNHAMDGQICGEICPLLPMMQAIHCIQWISKIHGRETNNCIFWCGIFYWSTRTSAMKSPDLAQYQCTPLVNDQQYNRVNGKHLPKRIKTVDQRGCACWFQFVMKWGKWLLLHWTQTTIRPCISCLSYQVHWSKLGGSTNASINIWSDRQHCSHCECNIKQRMCTQSYSWQIWEIH